MLFRRQLMGWVAGRNILGRRWKWEIASLLRRANSARLQALLAMQGVVRTRSLLSVLSKVACVRGDMSELAEARDFNGELYVSANNLVAALERARKNGAEHERVRLTSMLTPHERKLLRVREVCAEAEVSYEAVMGRNNFAHVSRVRQRLFLEFREMGMSLPEIGRFFDRDHTTVLHGINAEKERRNGLGNTGEFREAVEVAEAAGAICETDSDDRHG